MLFRSFGFSPRTVWLIIRSPMPSGYCGATRRTSHSGSRMARAVAIAAATSRRRVVRFISVPSVLERSRALGHRRASARHQWRRVAALAHAGVTLHLLVQCAAEVGAVEREHARLLRHPGERARLTGREDQLAGVHS